MACQADGDMQVLVDQFLASVQEHVDMERQILGELSAFPVIHPQLSTDAWADWLLAGDLLGMSFWSTIIDQLLFPYSAR